MQRHILWLSFLFCFSLLAHGQSVYTIDNTPDPKRSGGGYVSDPTNVLSADSRSRLNQMIGELESKSTAQIAVVLLPSIGDEVPKDFATRLFQRWGIGQASKDNGLLLLVVMDQRRSELETGYGMEGLLPDVVCYRILLEELVPRFQAGDYDGGVLATIRQIKTLLEDPAALEELRAELDPYRGWPSIMGRKIHPGFYWYGVIALLFGIGVLGWVVVTLFNKEDLYDKYRHVRVVTGWGYLFLFPLPYLVLYFIFRGVLKRLRNQPRYSNQTGALMHKLTEEEEDAFLQEGQTTEEEIGSADYDVWVTEDHSDIMILRYAARLTEYERCPKCNFVTYHLESSRVLRNASYSHSGEKELLHECKNCHYVSRKTVVIPRKTHSSSGGGGGGGGSWGGGSSGGGGGGASW